ncbi:hypothetical protein METHB2_900004 [Candidatus Methylobacter favarea]|uniref:Uncharacterized protein n=1 Tax=Candidatus Methylobacter favarea TaxID=2707345 RepID=A0A8S0X3R9_9GAMM|nr:hypothetical protein [Candidatus Methylobacter favarea]CAA9892994.1 hypothetical protein METHB2_900004 [Candidatus Methylobacter favarea]
MAPLNDDLTEMIHDIVKIGMSTMPTLVFDEAFYNYADDKGYYIHDANLLKIKNVLPLPEIDNPRFLKPLLTL